MAIYTAPMTGDSRYSLELTISESSSNSSHDSAVVEYIIKLKYAGSLAYGAWSSDKKSSFQVRLEGVQVTSGGFSYNFKNYSSLTLASGTRTVARASNGRLILPFYGAINMDGKGTASINGSFLGTTAGGFVWVGTKNGLKSGEVYIGTSSGVKKAVAVYVGTQNGVNQAI